MVFSLLEIVSQLLKKFPPGYFYEIIIICMHAYFDNSSHPIIDCLRLVKKAVCLVGDNKGVADWMDLSCHC